MKQITTNQLRKRIEEELSYYNVEQIHVTFCCPVMMGGYKKEETQTFAVDADEVVKAVEDRRNKIAIGKIDTAYTDCDFRYTLFIDIVEL